MTANILKTWILTTLALLFFTGAASYIFLSQAKKEAAETLSRSVRESLIVKDFRSSIMILSKNVPYQFDDISFLDTDRKPLFSVTESRDSSWFTINIVVPMYQDASRVVVFGYLVFSYAGSGYLHYLVGLWFLEGVILTLIFLREKRNSARQIEIQIERGQALAQAELARRVAHDIRSPLSALGLIIGTLKDENIEQKQIIKDVVVRINGIANDLLTSDNKEREALLPIRSERVGIDLRKVIGAVIQEKIALYPEVQFKLDIHKASANLSINEGDLARIISNLLNNSVESIVDQKIIQVKVYSNQKDIYIDVIDFGSGIPEHILEKIGQQEVSTKGKDGNGIGLYSAFSQVRSWGGEIAIQSREGVGTRITLKIPEC